MPRKSWVDDLPPEMAEDKNMIAVHDIAVAMERAALDTIGVEDYTELTRLQGKQLMGAMSIALFHGAPKLGVTADMLVELVGNCLVRVVEDDPDAQKWN